MPTASLDELAFSQAKTGLSSVMDEVVHSHRPKVVNRHGGKERMLLVSPDDLAHSLDSFEFDLAVTFGEEGDVTVEARGLDVLGFGDSLDEAIGDLAEELAAYAHRFFERFEFYSHTDRADQAPWLLRFALRDTDEERVSLLYRDVEAAVSRHQAREEFVASAG